ncbi:PHD finger domain-containingprotein [Purpureocillium lavendulum]|uniref:PHD finger domain-containingprotein n=1 Tax=Purpureocillium lavendulum TaxID=1247861 RepID=A0AB34G4N0_9HYPO|nr:PHD finger domain-containingprotein [Purpureocillium lavendulum]
MAANMQHMAGVGQMGIPQQMRKPTNSHQLQQYVYQQILARSQPQNGLTWHANVSLNDRMGKAMELISNITLAVNGDPQQAANNACKFEEETFKAAPSKEAYDQVMNGKIMEFFKKRQENEPNIQNSLNAQAQAAQAAQAQAMMNMQAQMGRGMGQTPQQGFQHLQHQMQASQIPQQLQQQQAQQQQMGMAMGMQGGRGAMPNQQAMGMPPNRQPPQAVAAEMARLAQADKAKVMDLAAKLMSQTPEQQKANTRVQLQQRMAPQQLAELQAQGKDPLLWFFQTQAFHMLKNNMSRLQQQGGPQQGQNANQAAMMQQQRSQQSLQQQRPGMMNAGVAQSTDFAQFNPSMESIKDQQMTGLMAQQAGQMVVPASGAGARNPTPQPGNQAMAGQPGQNQTPRQAPQQPQQHMQQQQQQQQQQQGASLQQMKMNQAQQSQAQLQMKQQMQGQNGMMGGVGPSQSPAMNTLNTPVTRPPGGGMGQGMGQGGMQFGDQRFNQGIQRPNNQAFQTMLSSMTPDQRQALHGLPPEKLGEVMRRWQSTRQEQMAMNAGQMNPQNRPPNQFGGQMNMNMGMVAGQGPQVMQQQLPNGQGNGNLQQQQMQMPRMPIQNAQAQMMMDQMDLPPQVHAQIAQLPLEIKKWRDLKIWLSQNNTLPQNVKSQLSNLQQRQFQVLMQRRASMQQAGQAPGMNQMAGSMPGQMPNQQQQQQQPQTQPQQQPQPPQQQQQQQQQQMGIQRPMGNIPQQVLQVSPQELLQVRTQRPTLANMPDEQLRTMVMHMKRQAWLQQQQQQQQQQQLRAQQAQAQAQAQALAQGQQSTQAQMPSAPQAPAPMQSAPQAQPGQQQNRTPQPQNQAGPNAAMRQTAAMTQAGNQRQQPNQASEQARNNRPAAAKNNLKRPSTDDAADTTEPSNVANSGPSRPASQPNQQQGLKAPQFSAQQLASMPPAQRAKYEQFLKMQMAGQGQQATAMMQQQQAGNEAVNRLRQFSSEELRAFKEQSAPEIAMSPQERSDTAAKLQRIAGDMTKVSRGLTKWYSITRDDARAKMFFRTRLRIVNQFADGEQLQVLKDKFSIRSSEVDQARAMLESMAKDLAASMIKSGMMKPPGQGAAATGAQNAQQQQQQQPQPQQSTATAQQPQQGTPQNQPAPLSAANLEKNSQAISKMNQQKGSAKANQVPPAPTATQPPFPFGAASPHGNPSYIGKPKDMNLQLPPARKKAKLAGQQPGQTPQGATPSPKMNKNASPEMRRVEPPKPVFPCKDPECANSTLTFASEQALQRHVQEEHVKPREDPLKFCTEHLALALGLEPDGSPKKPAEASAAMSASTSKQGQTPSNLAGTPVSQDGGMKRTTSAAGKAQESKKAGKADASSQKQGDGKPDAAQAAARADPWANCTIDPQAFFNNLGWEKGIGLPNLVSEANMYRSLTPKDTPESSKDSGASEPNSDISENAALDIDVYWHTYEHVDSDLLLNLDSATLNGETPLKGPNGETLDPMMLLHPPRGPAPDWDSMKIDFSEPFELDLDPRFYSMGTY